MQLSGLIITLMLVALAPVPHCHAAPSALEKIRHLARRGWTRVFDQTPKIPDLPIGPPNDPCANNGCPNTPFPSPPPPPRDDDCFPGDAVVQLEDGSRKRMHDIKVGDRVLVTGGQYSDVFIISHSLPKAKAEFLQLATRQNHTLRVTPDHFVYVNGNLASAGSASVGDTLTLADGTTSTIASIGKVWKDGVFNVLTLRGDIVVDGVLASTYVHGLCLAALNSLSRTRATSYPLFSRTACSPRYTTKVHPTVNHAMLAPLRALYLAGVPFQDVPDQWIAKAKPLLRAVLPGSV